MSSSASGESEWFLDGPPLRLHPWLGVAQPGASSIARRAALAIGVAWVPLLALSEIADRAPQTFLADFSAHFKYLIAVPVLVIADAICAPRLSAIGRNFVDAGLVRAADRSRFDAATASTARLRNSVLADLCALVLAYGIVAALFYLLHGSATADWHWTETDGGRSVSIAGWWLLLVSLPLLLTLILSWAWRWVLWSRFLWLMARLDLRLVPSHPDRAGGLRFTAYSLRACWPLALAFGALVAGDVANSVLHGGASLASYRYLVIEVSALSVVFFSAPLFVYLPQLVAAWRRGVFEYGALADRFGHEFERRWLSRDTALDESVLQQSDFSAATDLYQIVDRVHDMRLMPFDFSSVVMLAVATLLPFVPILLLALPIDTIIDRLGGLLL